MAGWWAPLTANAFNQLGQYASSLGNKAYCYAELSVSFLAVATTSLVSTDDVDYVIM